MKIHRLGVLGLIVFCEALSIAGAQSGATLGKRQSPIFECFGIATNGLQPLFRVETYPSDCIVDIGFLAQGDYSDRTWLLITNAVGAKLKLTAPDGSDIPLQDSSAMAALHLQRVVSVSNIMMSVRRFQRGAESRLWWSTDLIGSLMGQSRWAYTFNVRSCFNFPVVESSVLQITPLIYRVGEDAETARLVEFAPVKIVLSTKGGPQQAAEPQAFVRNTNFLPAESTLQKIEGVEAGGLEPCVYLYKVPASYGWEVDVAVCAKVEALHSQFFKVPNHVGSKVQIWSANGSEVLSNDRDLIASAHLPKETGHIGNLEALYLSDGLMTSIAAFGLQDLFNIVLSNNCVLQITPLVYELDTNSNIAHMVDFQPILIRLHTDGTVEKLK